MPFQATPVRLREHGTHGQALPALTMNMPTLLLFHQQIKTLPTSDPHPHNRHDAMYPIQIYPLYRTPPTAPRIPNTDCRITAQDLQRTPGRTFADRTPKLVAPSVPLFVSALTCWKGHQP